MLEVPIVARKHVSLATRRAPLIIALDHDPIQLNWVMIQIFGLEHDLSENRIPLFGIML